MAGVPYHLPFPGSIGGFVFQFLQGRRQREAARQENGQFFIQRVYFGARGGEFIGHHIEFY